MFIFGEIIEFLSGVGLAVGFFILTEDTDLLADGDGSVLKAIRLFQDTFRRVILGTFRVRWVKGGKIARFILSPYLVITSDHNNTDTSSVTILDGWLDFSTWWIQHTANTNEGDVLK